MFVCLHHYERKGDIIMVNTYVTLVGNDTINKIIMHHITH